MKRKFALRHDVNATEREQLICRGRGYDVDSTTAAPSRRRGGSRRRHFDVKAFPASRTSSLPVSSGGGITVAGTARSRSVTDSGLSLSQLAQSSVRRIQLRCTRTLINQTPHAADST